MEKNLIKIYLSPFGLTVFFVQKKNSFLHLIMDYQALNVVTIKNRYPLPLISKLLNQLGRSIYFPNINLIVGYNQVYIIEQDILKQYLELNMKLIN